MHVIGHLLAVVALATTTSPADRAAAMDLLRTWDEARTSAYAASDRDALADLYAAGAGRADLAVLAGYRERGLTVWLRTQVFSAAVLTSRPDRVELRVTDRTATVVGDGVRCRTLPTTLPATRDVMFVRRGDRWLVGAVRPVRPAAPR